MQQPSAQGIAALFRGNPAPLQQRIQMEQQGKPGLPPDLQKLLALNIVTNEKDAVAKQQAMNQLAQMQGPQGKPPTVMESVQEQARQKMQAQQVQAQRQQQAMQAMMQQAGPGPVPEGTPQPQAQPQGIDELPVEFSMAEGGIIAFEKGGRGEYETPYDRMNRRNRGELTEEERRDQELREALISQIPTGGEPTVTGGERVRGSEVERNILNTLAALPGAGAAKATTVGRQALAGIASLLGMDKSNAPEGRATPQAAPQAAAPRDAMPTPTSQRPGDVFVPRRTPEAPIADLKSLAEKERRQQAPRPAPAAAAPAPMPAAAPVATGAAPAQESDAEKLRKARMALDPAAERIAEQERRRREIGELDTSTHDRMIAELEKRKAQLEGPQDSFGKLMEYLGQVAATPRGMSSFEAGAAGAANVRKLEKARQLEQFDLSKQALDVSQKKIDAVRAFATEQYNVGKTRFDQVYKEQFEAAKEITKDESEARRLAQENTLKRLEIEQRDKEASERNKTQLQGYAMQQLGERNEQARIDKITSLKQQARRATDPKIAAELMAQATDLEALVGRGGGAGSAIPKPMTRDQASDNVAKALENFSTARTTIADAKSALTAAGVPNPTMAQIREHLIQEQMRGVSLTPSGPSGKVPAVGTVMDGYKFKGGNPADQKNWEKV